ncbi:transposase [Microbispora sp. CA-135349]|uniref:transposase n=1 Tax=Microbispora sp. CA-135349 TaxID=3239953 RepID=UPI003D8C3C94
METLTGRFEEHHAELARLLLDQIDALTAQIDRLTMRVEQLPTQITSTPTGRSIVRPIAERLDGIPGIGALAAQVIIAEVGLDMTRFPTADHLVSWAKLSPRTIQSGDKNTSGKIGKGNPHLKGVLGQAAAVAARTDTFLGERFRRIVKRRGKLRALVAVARSLLVVIWHLLADPTATSTTWDRTTTSADWTPAERYAPTSGTAHASTAGDLELPLLEVLSVVTMSPRSPRRRC